MQSISQLIPGYRINEYILVLQPHEELRSRIMQVRKSFQDTYNAFTAATFKPHIVLTTFTQYEMLEERLVNRLKLTGMGFQPFKVELKDYGCFPSHSIYIKVATRVPVQMLMKELRAAQRLMKTDNEHKTHFFDEPYIAIARKLQPWQFAAGWKAYSHRHFTGKFIADNMLLLKRRAGDKSFQVAQRFEFMNLPVSTRQGELFF